MKKLKVIFRKKDNVVIAFLPNIEVNYGNIMSYMHIGQHTESKICFYRDTQKATEEEYRLLLEELKVIYNNCILEVKQKLYYSDLLKSWR